MRVLVIINSKAGSVNEFLVRHKVQEALFRCELRFVVPQTIADLETLASEEIGKSDYIMICGGDGTINRTLQSLVRFAGSGPLPPIAIIRSGTANDLAQEMNVSLKVDKAARAILEGGIKLIDLIEIEADTGEKTVMITNGGFGIPALIAGDTNRLREFLTGSANNEALPGLLRSLARGSAGGVRKMGSSVYILMVAEALRRWSPADWQVEIELPGGNCFTSKASCILVNNQPRLGSAMTPAPFTSNIDGLVNLLVSEAHTVADQIKTVRSLLSGRPHELPLNRSFEVPEFRIRSLPGQRGLTFFGDGEILIKDAREIQIRCLPLGLPVVVGQEC